MPHGRQPGDAELGAHLSWGCCSSPPGHGPTWRRRRRPHSSPGRCTTRACPVERLCRSPAPGPWLRAPMTQERSKELGAPHHPSGCPRHGWGTGAPRSTAQPHLTSRFPQNHWYTSPGGPAAQQVRDTRVPSVTTCDSGCTVMQIMSWTAGETNLGWPRPLSRTITSSPILSHHTLSSPPPTTACPLPPHPTMSHPTPLSCPSHLSLPCPIQGCPTHPTPSHPVPSYPTPLCSTPSHLIPPYFVPSHLHHVPCHPFLSHYNLSKPVPSHPVPSQPAPPHPIPPHPILSHPTASTPSRPGPCYPEQDHPREELLLISPCFPSAEPLFPGAPLQAPWDPAAHPYRHC